MYQTYLYNPQTGYSFDLMGPDRIGEALKDDRNLLWVDIQDVDDNDIDLLSQVFSLHPLTIEDFIMTNSRPKVENFNDYVYMVVFSMEAADNGKSRMNVSEIDICLGKNYLITGHSGFMPALGACANKVREMSPDMKNGADRLLYALLDSIVHSYIPVINGFDNLVDEMSDELFGDPTNQTLKKIYLLKNEITALRRTIGPQADVISVIARGDMPHIRASNLAYFRDIYDELVRLNDIVGTSRDIITGAMEAYVSIVSNRLNEIMKTLTIIATIMMPLTLIASIYGMNFKHMPELESRMGYPAVILTMVVILAAMLYYFKRKRWL